MNEFELMDRAIGALSLRAQRTGEQYQQPNAGLSEIEIHNGISYVVLRNINGVLAAYRVCPNGSIRETKNFEQAA